MSDIFTQCFIQLDKSGGNPNDIFTCLEFWQHNLYLGTSEGEIIHLYKVDDSSEYMHVSRQCISNTKKLPVTKIIVLPEISRVLVLSGHTLSGFILPELTPAGMGRVKDVWDVSLDWGDMMSDDKESNHTVKKHTFNQESYCKLTIFTKNSIKMLRIFSDSIRLHKDVQCNGCIAGVQRSNHVIVARDDSYELIDMDHSQKIQLFPIMATSETVSNILPIIRSVSKNEFLLVCGGNKKADPAMGMIIDVNGDVTRSTIAWDEYPDCLAIDFPYVLAIIGGNRLIVSSLHEQGTLQTIQLGLKDKEIQTDTEQDNIAQQGADEINDHLTENRVIFKEEIDKGNDAFEGKLPIEFSGVFNIQSVSKIFKIKNKDLVEKITMAPIISTMSDDEVQQIVFEADKASQRCIIQTSTICYDPSLKNLSLLQQQSRIDRWLYKFQNATKIDAQNIFDGLIDELSELPNDKFLISILGLFTLKFEMYNHAFELWSQNYPVLDPRLLIYIISGDKNQIYGSVWTFTGLFDIIENMKMPEFTRELKDFYILFLNSSVEFKFKEDHQNKIKSIELELLRYILKFDNDTDDVKLESLLDKIEFGKNEVIEQILLNKKYFILSNYYIKINDNKQFLYYWKGLIDGDFTDKTFNKKYPDKSLAIKVMIDFIKIHFANDKQIVWKYMEWLILTYPALGLGMAMDAKFDSLDLSISKIVNALEDKKLKLEYLEFVYKYKKEKQFLGDLVLLLLELFLQYLEKDKDKVNKIFDSYMKLSIPKVSFLKFWKANKFDLKEEFVKMHDKLYNSLAFVGSDTNAILYGGGNILDICTDKILQSEFKMKIPLLSAMILYKKSEYYKLMEIYCQIEDFTSAEYFASTLQLNTLENKYLNDKIFDKYISDELLKNIFEIYLQLEHTELIDNFINKHDLLNDSIKSDTKIDKKMDKFVEIINKLPNNFPVSQLHNFFTFRLVDFKVYDDDLVVKRNLLRMRMLELTQLKKNMLDKYCHTNNG